MNFLFSHAGAIVVVSAVFFLGMFYFARRMLIAHAPRHDPLAFVMSVVMAFGSLLAMVLMHSVFPTVAAMAGIVLAVIVYLTKHR